MKYKYAAKLNRVNSSVKFFFVKTQIGIFTPNNISVFNFEFSEIYWVSIFIVLWMRMIK